MVTACSPSNADPTPYTNHLTRPAWKVRADPVGADKAWRQDDAREELTIAPTTGGYHLTGWLDELSGQVVTTALTAHAGRKGAEDDRTPAQRRAGALVALAHECLDRGEQQANARVRPHVTITATLDTLTALTKATGSVIPPASATAGWLATHDLTPNHGQAHAGLPAGQIVAPITAEQTLTAPGGPRDPHTTTRTHTTTRPHTTTRTHAGAAFGIDATFGLVDERGSTPDGSASQDGSGIFDLSETARQWLTDWQPGEDHVISAAIDPRVMDGIQPATFEDGTPIPHAMLARLACDSALMRVIFGPESTVLDVGRDKRIFPANMTRAIHARDQHCQYPDCDEPPGFGEIHHSLHWYKDHGPTSIEHGILLCWHHHDLIHTRNITITRRTGHWHFHDQHGRPITSRTPTGRDEPHQRE
ncbi:DUF222 domain-containing protein [Georgenia sp. Z1491]|uniref:HNH endonuclease signature motif containing protein n=1 Tax=Georgenia sp. Z1491 TaxID=3416707 RepID=UPI003CEFCE39